MRYRWSWAIGLALLGSALKPLAGWAQTPGPIELHDGDRVVLVGGTLIEREAESGYLETQIARRYPGKTIVVRNLGWSGDTVSGESRAVGNPVQDGFKQLVDHVVALKPTVIVLGYGANEAFDGAAGLPKFAKDLARLWDALASTGARFVVLLPTRQANLGPPFPDPAAHNADLKLYSAALRTEAERRGAIVVDLFDLVPERQPDADRQAVLTTNGVHLSPLGYWLASGRMIQGLSSSTSGDTIATIDAATATTKPSPGTTITDLARVPDGLRFRITHDGIASPPLPIPEERNSTLHLPSSINRVRVLGLASGSYSLKADGQTLPLDLRAELWEQGLPVICSAETQQVEALRQKIVAKNLMYFHRWRPQNETYLFGFRKYEQGRNAAELPAFDPLIAAEEAEIARLSRPLPHVYELTRIGDASPAPAPAADPKSPTGEAPR